MRWMALCALVALAGCGVDGEPVQPSFAGWMGVSGSGDTNAGGAVGLHRGPLSLYLGF